MTIFEEIANTVAKLNKTKEQLDFLREQADSPRSCVISDMPKGGGNAGNPLEQYIIKKEKLQIKCARLTERLNELWGSAVRQMKDAQIDEPLRVMMYMRFVCGLQWKKCAQEMDKHYPNQKWNVNKCFRKYREILCRIKRV